MQPDVVTAFESQIVGPLRKAAMASTSSKSSAASAPSRQRRLSVADIRYATSPQGFLIKSDDADGAYLEVLMAQSSDAGGKVLPFAFGRDIEGQQTPIKPELTSALQTNQLFVVAVNKTALEPFQNLAAVAGWNMSAPVGEGVTATSYRNVLIMKFCSGTVLDRVGNPNRWTGPEIFSLVEGVDPSNAGIAYAGLSQWLSNYIQAGIKKASGPSADFYQNFACIAQDPDWNGVLVLESDLVASDLPAQIAGLAAGLDFTKFTTHHFGFTVSRVVAQTGRTPPLKMSGVSSFFGLIDYELPAYAQNLAAGVDPEIPVSVPTGGDFQFSVLLLQVLFENAKPARFNSRVQLTVQSLFGSRVIQSISNATPGRSDGTPTPANAVVLDGSYVAQSGADSTASSYVFEQSKTTVFCLDSNVLRAVAFDRIQFNTLTEDGTTTTSRFLVWGALDFAALNDAHDAGFDVLSFGSPPNTGELNLGTGLAFSNLSIRMSSPDATPSVQTFVVDTANLVYNPDASSSRPASLFRDLGSQPKGFITAAGAGETPAGRGFLPVSTGLNLVALGTPWYGVVYRLTLGGPGALASSAGFASDLLLAWSPSSLAADSRPAVFLGLSLPGATPGAKLFSLQGVFKVAVGAITLIRQPVPGTTGATIESFCLRLDDIGIKVLGIAKLPPDATIRFFLFGDPNGTGSLGWYAAYVADQARTVTPRTPAGVDAIVLPTQQVSTLAGTIEQKAKNIVTKQGARI